MPDSTTNYTSKYVPKSHFFTDPGAITQSSAQAFGPVSPDRFRVSSKFALAADAPAYAICAGVVLIQPQDASTDKVNVILRPYKQPINGLNIRYFVYRGLKKSDFFDGSNVKAATAASSDFIQSIDASFKAFYISEDANATVPDFLAKYIGYDPANQPNSLLLDDFFFKDSEYAESDGQFTEQEETAFELPIIAFGKTLGNFAAGECAVDVVLSYGDYRLPAAPAQEEFVFDLAYARAAEAVIDVTSVTDIFRKKVIREQVYQFLDVAAYFGFHHTDNGFVKIDNAGAKTEVKGDAIYTSVIQNFSTKNNLYLYIQSDRGRSYNFYGNYSLPVSAGEPTSNFDVKIGPSEESMAPQEFVTNEWPLLISNSAQAHEGNRNKVCLQLVTDNNVNAALYGAVAQVENAQRNNFMDADNLLLPPDANGERSELIGTIILSNPAVADPGDATVRLNIATFNLLLYQGKTYQYKAGVGTDEEGNPTDVFAQPNFFDDVFDLVNASPLLQGDSAAAYSSLTSQRLKLINQYFNGKQQGLSAVQTTIVNDVLETGEETVPTLQRVTYITEAVDVLNNPVSLTGAVSSDTKSSAAVVGAVAGDKAYELPAPYFYQLKTFTDGTQTVTGLELKTFDDSIPNKVILGVTKAENDLLKELIDTNNLINPRLFLVDLFGDTDDLRSPEDIMYQKYELGIVGENSTGVLELYLPVAAVLIYSLDRNYHFSKGYSDYMTEQLVTDLGLDLEVTLNFE